MSTKIISNLVTESELGQYLTQLVDAAITAAKAIPDHDQQCQIASDIDTALDQPNTIAQLFAVQDVVRSYGLILFTANQ